MEKKEEFKTVNEKIENFLLEKRRIFLSDAVDQESAKDIIRKLWYLNWKDPKKPILFVINSPGGAVDSGFAIFDQIKLLSSPVYTLITGLAASMGSLLSLAAVKGKRFATKYSRIMIHQPLISGVIRGQATDLDIQAREMLKTRNLIVKIYSEATSKDVKIIEKAIDRDNWMTPEEAMKFGLLDKIIDNPEEIDGIL
ncbi:MAG: Clp protease [Chlamydiae bacterium SM23_39]|nr:MAG: Clp protease [Chlamydiae bacterium SM23_39]